MGTRYVRGWLPGLARSLRAKEMYMSSRTGNWMIAVGAFGMFIGLCLVPAAMGPNPDSSVLALAACVFSFGALITASGMYLKARGLQSAAASAPETKNGARRVRGGCELCGSDTPVIQCKVHQLHLCPACLAQHYDFRSCAYVPSTRRTTGKTTGKTAGKQRGAAKARSASFS